MADKNIPKYEDTAPISYEQTQPIETKPDVSTLESGIRGLAQGATMGFADELEGLGKAGIGAIQGEADLTGEGDAIQRLKDLYSKYRDISREKYKAAEEANPKTFTAGEIGGGLATMAIPGVGALGAGKGIAGAAKAGAALGAIGGLGKSEADLGSLQEIKDVAGGAAMGGAAGAVGGAIGKGIEKVLNPEMSKKAAESAAARALDISTAEAGKLGDKRVLELGRGALDNILKGGATTDTEIRAASKELIKKVGPEIEAAREQANKLVTQKINPEDILEQIREKLPTQDVNALEKLSPDYNKIKTILNTFVDENGQIPYNRLREVQKVLQEEGYNAQGVTPASAKTMAQSERIVDDIAKSRLAKTSAEGERLSNLLESLNKQYAPAATGARNLDEKIAKEIIKPKGLVSSVKEAAQLLVPSNASQARGFENISKFMGTKPVQAIKTGATTLASKAGLGAAGAVKEGKPANSYADVTDEQLQAASERAASKGNEQMANVIKSLAGDTPETRNAKLYALGQQPSFRALLEPEQEETQGLLTER